MYINSTSIKELEESLCQIFEIDNDKLNNDLSNLARNSNDDDIDDKVEKYIQQNIIHKPDNVLLFHLSRRLDTATEDYRGLSLVNLLTTKNKFSEFFEKYDITYKLENGRIEVYKRKNKIYIDEKNDANFYIMKRLGYFKNNIDFCFNGFIVNPLIGDNIYNTSLSEAPEFIINISKLLNNKNILKDYQSNSKYYCYKYLIPINEIILDYKTELNNEEKIIYMIKKYIMLFINYRIFSNKEKTNTEIIGSLSENEDLLSEYYIDKIIIEK